MPVSAKAVFAAEFNKLARKPFDEGRFLQVAAENGWTEARVQRPGQGIIILKARQHDRITAQLNEDGYLRRYIMG